MRFCSEERDSACPGSGCHNIDKVRRCRNAAKREHILLNPKQAKDRLIHTSAGNEPDGLDRQCQQKKAKVSFLQSLDNGLKFAKLRRQ